MRPPLRALARGMGNDRFEWSAPRVPARCSAPGRGDTGTEGTALLAQDLLDAQVSVELPKRELLSITLAGSSDVGSRLGDAIRLFLLPLVPPPPPVNAPVSFA